MSTLKGWANAHHVHVPLRPEDKVALHRVVHDQRFWAAVVVVTFLVALLALALVVDVMPGTMQPPHPYLDTYMMY